MIAPTSSQVSAVAPNRRSRRARPAGCAGRARRSRARPAQPGAVTGERCGDRGADQDGLEPSRKTITGVGDVPLPTVPSPSACRAICRSSRAAAAWSCSSIELYGFTGLVMSRAWRAVTAAVTSVRMDGQRRRRATAGGTTATASWRLAAAGYRRARRSGGRVRGRPGELPCRTSRSESATCATERPR
jgi:hypothetical protein